MREGAASAPAQPPPPAYKGSAGLERLKSLAGKWKGASPTMPMPVTAEYRVTGGGAVVEERLFAGTPMEMLTTYHDENGRLALTHYCCLHNQPKMKLAKSTTDSLSFNFVPTSGIDPAKDEHMHAVTLSFVDGDTLRHDWAHWKGGKPQPSQGFELKRR